MKTTISALRTVRAIIACLLLTIGLSTAAAKIAPMHNQNSPDISPDEMPSGTCCFCC